MKLSPLVIMVLCTTLVTSTRTMLDADQVSSIKAQSIDSEWYMAGANPERTSWVSEEIRGYMRVEWYKPIEPYVSAKVQVIAANGLLYISTARGLYAIDAETGDEIWVYPTELPLGHSPTVVNGVAYVGGFDRRMHAIDAATGQGLWTFAAGGGFQTNPLVVGDKLYAGNRDGYFYAIYVAGPNAGQLAWRYETGGPVLYSAAYKDGVVFFASNDSYAYALDVADGALVWKSAKLPGAGFHSWWPVIYEEFVVFSGSLNYRDLHTSFETADIYENPDGTYPSTGSPLGSVITEEDGSITIDATKVTEYFEEPTEEERIQDPAGLQRKDHKPWRRTVFYLDRRTGQEYAFDSDNDGQMEYAPILFHGTHSGNRYPPVVGRDAVIYQANNYYADRYIPRGGITGWRVGTPHLINVPRGTIAVDEPAAGSAGGNLVYVNHWSTIGTGSVDVSSPGSEWNWWSYGGVGLAHQISYINLVYWGARPEEGSGHWNPVYGNRNGVYGAHGDQDALIPYRGKVYMIDRNVLFALSPSVEWGDEVQLSAGRKRVAPESSHPDISTADLRRLLDAEVSKIVAAGHLQPGFVSTGIADYQLNYRLGDHLVDYWKAPGDTIYHLIRALPHLSLSLQQQVKDYLKTEFDHYPPYRYVHVGWRDGTQREAFDRPPEMEVQRTDSGPATSTSFSDWSFPPHQFYAMWQYAEMMDDPVLSSEVFDNSKHRLEMPPPDAELVDRPYVHNAYIAGYIGYIELGKLAGLTSEQLGPQQCELDRLLALRISTFSKDSPYEDDGVNYARELNIARNFMFLVPELADHLRDHLKAEIREAIDEYNEVAPYWFVSQHECSFREGVISPLYNYHGLFQAKAQILQEPREELLRYLDVPSVEVGDLFYIDNLVAALEAMPELEKAATPSFANQGDTITYTIGFYGSDCPLVLTDTLPTGTSAPADFELEGTSFIPTYDANRHLLTWSDAISGTVSVRIRYAVTAVTSEPQYLDNVVELQAGAGAPAMARTSVLVNGSIFYLPLVHRDK